MSLVGAGAGAAARDGTATGEAHALSGLPAGQVGTGAGVQEAAPAGIRVGAGTGLADPDPFGRVIATGAGDLSAVGGWVGTADGDAVGAGVPATVAAADGVPVFSVPVFSADVAVAVCDTPDEACPPSPAAAVPEHPVSARPAATPSTVIPSAVVPSAWIPGTRTPAGSPGTGGTPGTRLAVTGDVFLMIRTCILLGVAVGDDLQHREIRRGQPKVAR